MLRRIARFFRRLFSSKGFQRGLRVFLWVFIALCFVDIIIYFRAVLSAGASFWDALSFLVHYSLFGSGWFSPAVSVALGIAAGLIWYFSRRTNKQDETEPDEKKEESPDAVREEEIIETTHYRYH